MGFAMWRVRQGEPRHAASWLRLRSALWPDGPVEEHRENIERYFEGRLRNPVAVFLAEDDAGQAVGFAELSIRLYAEGCLSDRVAYLEGWYVEPERRNQGIGRALIAAAEASGREQGCTEFASDADPTNDTSIAAHGALGFTDAGLIRCFRKDL